MLLKETASYLIEMALKKSGTPKSALNKSGTPMSAKDANANTTSDVNLVLLEECISNVPHRRA